MRHPLRQILPGTALVCSVLFLWVCGALVQLSADMDTMAPWRFQHHLVFGAAGCVLMVLGALLDYRRWQWRGVGYWILGLSLVLLIAVLFQPATAKINGARRWFRGFGQPSDLAKLALIIALAHYYTVHSRFAQDFKIGFMRPCLAIGATAFLVLVEPDWGTCVLICAVGGIIMLCAGVRWKHFLWTAGAAMLALAFGICLNELKRERFLAFLHPQEYRLSVAWQSWNTLLAMAVGGLWGRGFGQGRFKGRYVPEQSTDFVLSNVGEEWGLCGTLLVLGAFAIIFSAGMAIAARAREPFGRLLAIGISYLIALQAIINFGVATSLLPNKGISLPFVSYGGSNLLVMMAAVGMLLSVARVASRETDRIERPRHNPFGEADSKS